MPGRRAGRRLGGGRGRPAGRGDALVVLAAADREAQLARLRPRLLQALDLRPHLGDDRLGVLAGLDAVGGPLDQLLALLVQLPRLVDGGLQLVGRIEPLDAAELLGLDRQPGAQEREDLAGRRGLGEGLEALVGVGADGVGLLAELVGAQRAGAPAAAGDEGGRAEGGDAREGPAEDGRHRGDLLRDDRADPSGRPGTARPARG